jgi:predicted ATPase/DNA-binding SARP family transcriptional activator
VAEPHAVRRLTIRLLGRARCKTESAEGAFPARPASTALFVALAFAQRPVARDWLAAALWPDVTDAAAKANLRRHLSYVDHWLQAFTGASAPILRTGSTLALDPGLVEWLDVRAFEDAVANGAFEDAFQIYGGDLLEGHDEQWIAVERQRLSARYGEVLVALVERARAANQTDAALRYAETARAIDPYNEAWLRMTMRVRYAAGDRAGALHEYEAYRALVARELDVEPMPETSMLADSMRRLELEITPAPLSFESTSFVGRAREEQRLCELIAAERLVTVTGEPGVGKSRLALRCVRSLAAGHGDGFVVVDAAAAGDAEGLERLVRRGFAARAPSAPDDSFEALAGRLDAILFLDGCERIASACAELVQRIGPVAPHVRVVTSSRKPLGVAGEAVFRLGPLRAAEAAQLFFERLRLARPQSQIVDESAVVERICRKLDGLPLAIELAAARARMSTLEQVERDVRRYAGRPESGSLYAAYESSYDVLSALERAVLRRLAVFTNGWSAGIALAACADLAPVKDVLAAFTSLVEHSLVVPPGVTEVGGRYSMLDATRDFALYRARSLGETESDASAHALAIARHYVAIGRRLRAEHAAEHYPELERDRENVEAALATLWRGGTAERALAVDLSLAMSRFWADQGSAREGERWLRKALADVAPGDAAKRLELLRVVGTMTRDLGDYETSFRDFSELVRSHERARSGAVEIAKAQTMAANAARMVGDFDEALARTRLAHAAFEEHGEAYFAAWALYAIGTTLLSAGRFAEAAADLERATGAFNDAGAVADSSSSIANLALCHYYEGRLGIAHELTRESLARASAVGHRYYYAHAALNDALILHALGEGERAWPRVVEAAAIGRALGAQDVTISCAETASAVLASTHPAEAAILLGSADSARERVHAHRFPVDRPLYDGVCAELRTSLGNERFEALHARGRVTPLRDAVSRLEDLEAR